MEDPYRNCEWLEHDAPLAVKYNTQCLGENIVESGGHSDGGSGSGYGTGSGAGGGSAGASSAGGSGEADVCHPIAYDYGLGASFQRRYNAVMDGRFETTDGHAPNVEIAVLLSVVMVFGICAYSACVRRGKEDDDYVEFDED